MFTRNDTNRIKGIAILLLVFHHMYRTIEDISFIGAKTCILTDARITQFAFCFRVCVYMFVFLSAYGISSGFKSEKNILKFYAYRLWRFLSPYWFTLVLLNVFFIFLYQKTKYSNPIYFLGDLIPVHDIFGCSERMFNAVFWYMNFTLVLILVLPFIYKLTAKFGVFLFVVTLATYGFVPVVFDSMYGGPYYSYIFAIELGILFHQKDLLASAKKCYGAFSKFTKVIVLISLLLFSFFFPYIAGFAIPDNRFGVLPIFLTLGALSLTLCIYLTKLPRIISVLLEFLGKYSYDMFLTHILVFNYACDLLKKVRFLIPQYIVSASLCLLIAFMIGQLKKLTRWEKLISMVSEKIMPAGKNYNKRSEK